jgi:tetratricopeptide (TPR) repeat protein
MKHTNIFAAIATVSAVSFGGFAFAAGSDSSEPPTPTETTSKCPEGYVYVPEENVCRKPKETNFTDDQIYMNARELAYDGQYETALELLDRAANPNDPRILNYKGFANRKAGNTAVAMDYYQAAIAIDPDYILARSYMGQGFVAEGRIEDAQAQLREIELRGGRDTWAFAALDKAIHGEVTNW